MLENVIQTTENCRYCLMCRHVCPVGHVTRKETLTPHGWGLTIASVKRGLLDWDENSVDVLYSCADCGTCRANCITDQPLPSAIAATRAEVARQNLAPAVVYEVHDKLRNWGNPYRNGNHKPDTVKGDVALFVGDEAFHLGRETLDAAIKLLQAIGINPVLIGVGRNNGYLASSLGFPETARFLAEATHEELLTSGAAKMLVLTPGDYYAFNQLHEERLGIHLPEQIELLEVIPLIEEKAAEGAVHFRKAGGFPPYTYVDPTHSVRVPTRFDAPRKLLQMVMPFPPKELFWRRERAHPCGNVALQFTQPHIANHLTYARLGDARQSGVQLLITEDPGSLAHLRQHADRFGLQILGFYELLADHLLGE